MFDITKPSDEEIIFNSKLDTIYQHQFEGGKCFSIISEEILQDKQIYLIKIASRTQIKIIFSNGSNEARTFEIVKFVRGQEKESVRLSNICTSQLKTFLAFLIDIDIGNFHQKQTVLSSNNNNSEIFEDFMRVIKNGDGEEILKQILATDNITTHDIVSTGYRKSQLNIFKKLLEEDYINDYKKDIINKPNTKDETAWQEFFTLNQWIFGYGLDYQFQGILQKEFHASDTNAAGKDGVISDFLLGNKIFTSFVEIKLPNTPLFGSIKNRSGCWKLSHELLEAYSQILEQKACGEIKIERCELFDENGVEIKQNAYDSKTFLIIGSLNSEENSCNDQEKKIKAKTFELFRRDSRNVEIITYDELYDRAKFIVENKS
ncbi:Shedu immune nuclease family protein [Psychrobacter sp. BF1]|uniref:Shedu immune nuclease family protein n=1 Tax=Psychrobacter sp. BF1 TaxID=2821147 RepID=UPI001C4DF27B|nr:Shedu immune nuclease family protein [Psychrobacter sp. BF1]